MITTAPPLPSGTPARPVDRQSALKDFSIIYFGNDWSAENRTSSHHIAERLAQRTRVLYVETPGLRAPKTSGRDASKLYRKLVNAIKRPRPIAPRMWHITVPQIPFRRLPLVGRLNAAVGKWLVSRAARQLGFKKAISWFVVPHPGALAGAFGEQLVVYYCIDDYAALPDVDAAFVAGVDAHLMRRADQVFVASELLLRARREQCPSAVHAPHGVDVALFKKASDPALLMAEQTNSLKHPIIGFFGLIEAWIDLDLIAYLAEQRPAWTFLMIGRLAVDPGKLRDLPNVVFAGPQPYASLPAWAKAFDVAIIPYRLTQQVTHSSPLKLREYLATGKPVVSVAAPEINRFKDCVRIASGPESFLHEIEDALAHDTAADRARRIAAVAGMSWESRMAEVVSVVEDRLRQKELRTAP